MKSISKQLYEKEVPLCVVCNENPSREGLKTCSKECSKAYQKAYMKAYNQRKKLELKNEK